MHYSKAIVKMHSLHKLVAINRQILTKIKIPKTDSSPNFKSSTAIHRHIKISLLSPRPHNSD